MFEAGHDCLRESFKDPMPCLVEPRKKAILRKASASHLAFFVRFGAMVTDPWLLMKSDTSRISGLMMS